MPSLIIAMKCGRPVGARFVVCSTPGYSPA